MRWTRIVALALITVMLFGVGRAMSGPLSDSEVIQRLGGVPTEMQVVGCSTSSATAANALPSNSLVRVVAEAGAIYYTFTTQAGTVTLANGLYLPAGLVEYLTNGANTYFACITRTAAATASISIMR